MCFTPFPLTKNSRLGLTFIQGRWHCTFSHSPLLTSMGTPLISGPTEGGSETTSMTGRSWENKLSFYNFDTFIPSRPFNSHSVCTISICTILHSLILYYIIYLLYLCITNILTVWPQGTKTENCCCQQNSDWQRHQSRERGDCAVPRIDLIWQ